MFQCDVAGSFKEKGNRMKSYTGKLEFIGYGLRKTSRGVYLGQETYRKTASHLSDGGRGLCKGRKIAKSYTSFVESHDRLCPIETQHIEE